MAIEKLKRHKSLAIDQILAELIEQEVKKFILRSVNLLILISYRFSVNCEMNYKLYQHQQMHNSTYCLLYYQFFLTCFGTIAIFRDLTSLLLNIE